MVATLALHTASAVQANSASVCLTSPKGTPPEGERWYYRVERGTKRHCWYTRGGASRKTVAQNPQPAKADVAGTAEPLQLSVANARAEADLSELPRPPLAATPREILPAGDTDRQWTLAERWSEHRTSNSPEQLRLMSVAPRQAPQAAPPAAADETSPESFLDIAAGAVVLLGLSSVLMLMILIRRRKPDPCAENGGPSLQLTDLNDEPLMTWRKGPKEELRMARRSDRHRHPSPPARPST